MLLFHNLNISKKLITVLNLNLLDNLIFKPFSFRIIVNGRRADLGAKIILRLFCICCTLKMANEVLGRDSARRESIELVLPEAC